MEEKICISIILDSYTAVLDYITDIEIEYLIHTPDLEYEIETFYRIAFGNYRVTITLL